MGSGNAALEQGKSWEERQQVLKGWGIQDDGPHGNDLLQDSPSNTELGQNLLYGENFIIRALADGPHQHGLGGCAQPLGEIIHQQPHLGGEVAIVGIERPDPLLRRP